MDGSANRNSSSCAVCGGAPQTAKDGATWRYLAGVPLKTLMLELGQESLATTQRYLADVRKPGEAINKQTRMRTELDVLLDNP